MPVIVYLGDVPLEPHQKLNEMKLISLCNQNRFGLTEFTVDEALKFAIEAEITMKECGVGDPAYDHFSKEFHLFERLALLLEAREPYKHKFPLTPIYISEDDPSCL